MNKGFTLIELLLVISLMSVMLFFAIPRFHEWAFQDEGKQSTQRLINQIQFLKQKSQEEGITYILHMDVDTNGIWISEQGMDEAALQEAKNNIYTFPDNFRIIDVEFIKSGIVSDENCAIRFYPGGYSDKALIHVQTDQTSQLTFTVESFLSFVTVDESSIHFE
ncbi:MAG: prepilin-type N-terminal cleavage/methylation domain-containing protein [Desulfobacterales bacterium]|nr:prepilin-type N-terminal cleavage/methylation domain-containing protein [Desulfobacterales bacterium]